MRKVLSFVLVLSLVLGSFGMAFAAPLSDMAGEKSEDAVSVLTELGVVKGYPDGTYKPANIVTRAEMAVIVVSALGLADYAVGTANFSDMGGHWSNNFVAYAASLGIIAGYPDGTFKPDKTVSYDEAATMLVAALGYTPGSLQGTWPANYVVKAKSLGILDGIKAGAAGANRGDIAIMAYQTLDAPIGTTDNDGKWTANVPADTMLDRLGAQDFDPGAAGSGALPYQTVAAGVSTVGAEFVVSGDEDSIISLKELQGALVTAYANSDNEIIAIKEVKSVFYTGKIDGVGAGPAVLAAGDEIGDYELRSAAIPAAATTDTFVFANGTAVVAEVATATFADDDEVTIAAKISGNYITAIYSIATWTVDAAFVFEDGDLEDDNIDSNYFVLNDDDEIDMDSFALFGVSSLDDIEEGNVVYVYDDGAGSPKVTRLDVGTEVVTGEVTKITSAATPKITVDGKVYTKSSAPGNDAANWSALGLKDEVEFYLDYAGKVYDVKIVDSEADNYAILLETDDGEAGLSGKDGVAKLLLADGTDKVFTVDNDLVVLGVIEANGDWALAYEDDSAAGTIIEYGLDKDGKIDALTVFPTATVLTGNVTATDTKVDGKYFAGKAIASDVLVFTYDGARADLDPLKADEDKYGVTSLDKIKGNEYADVDFLYDNDIKQIVAMVIIGAGSSDDEVYGLVTGWFNTTASDTDMMVTVLVDGVEKEYELTTAGKTAITAAGFNEDMLQMLDFTASGQVRGAVEVDAHGAGEATEADLVETALLTVAYENGVLSTAADEYTIAADAIAYKWDTVELEFTKKAVSKSNLAIGVTVYLYDLNENGVIDLILYR